MNSPFNTISAELNSGSAISRWGGAWFRQNVWLVLREFPYVSLSAKFVLTQIRYTIACMDQKVAIIGKPMLNTFCHGQKLVEPYVTVVQPVDGIDI